LLFVSLLEAITGGRCSVVSVLLSLIGSKRFRRNVFEPVGNVNASSGVQGLKCRELDGFDADSNQSSTAVDDAATDPTDC